ncbi:MAG TPA: hypothetical protein VN579_01850, partial [Bryobacteraceae bacterium]|nr:hypothetical protein [Bryobacteraceae bacterium]
RRVAPANISFTVPVTPSAVWLPKLADRTLHREIFLALDEQGVRGAYTLKLQEFLCGGAIRTVGSCQMPISEGIVDKRYALVGLQIMQDALRRQPLAYDLGIGSFDASIAKVHKAMGWSFRALPFYFRIQHGGAFAREIRYLRTSPLRRALLNLAAWSGIASLGAMLAHWGARQLATLRHGVLAKFSRNCDVFAESFSSFGCWADDIWRQCGDHYSTIAVRTAEILNILYPPDNERFIRIRVLRRDRTVGWAVLLCTRMAESKYFGNMLVGSVVDCLAAPGEEATVMEEALRILARRDADIVVTNQSHSSWRQACRMAGFIEGPSNYILGSSKAFSALLNECDPRGDRVHITRGDGDGPIHL